jgi:hypothetical protein
MVSKTLRISLYSLAIAVLGLPMSIAAWVALALIGY